MSTLNAMPRPSAPSPDHPGEFWDQRFSESGFAYGDEPNDFLRQQGQQLIPGQAV
jgi:hypothetical protein